MTNFINLTESDKIANPNIPQLNSGFTLVQLPALIDDRAVDVQVGAIFMFEFETDVKVAVGSNGYPNSLLNETNSIEEVTIAATNSLYHNNPNACAKGGAGRSYGLACVIIAILAVYGVVVDAKLIGFYWFVAGLSVGIMFFRLLGALFSPEEASSKPCSIPQIAPIYTVMVALYRESSVVADLIDALLALEWPKDKLDLIFLCEAGDEKTIEALKSQQNRHPFRIIILPKGIPQTKPRALQVGLQFARGQYITIYDAEDKPDKYQLLRAYEAFIHGEKSLAVVQAPLITWNHNESWIAGQFFVEYAMWFRVILPTLNRFSNFIPLGGTSNHFKASALKEVGGWDPYNLTEDADLGARFCRYGYRATLISAPTYEEAPPKFGIWLKQRGRWIHGHLQTIGVNMRDPITFVTQMGLRGTFAFMVGILAGPLCAAMRAPFVLLVLANALFFQTSNVALGLALLGFGAPCRFIGCCNCQLS
ncbi:MAG: family 2 glycosyl transferase [Hyphomonadaceae bacterium]|nr:MAG: family 2 glycosyl transferase [Hyphomonadaceae bacterium]